ncbi:NYN domain-containing protein [Frankia sp. EAN1pec]|uniref:NYN domain-containing protein n=1 Tax=Parafrankia sp. (strain EAN1pec) TaxID=298653 RepID=UPI0000543874
MVDGVGSARLAVLIDAENVPLWTVEPLLAEIARYGKAQVRRAYGDWAGSLRSWKKTLLELSIRPVQVFAAVKGKNAADLALTIDAMDLLHAGSIDGICLVSPLTELTAWFAQVNAGARRDSVRVLVHDRRRGDVAGSCRVGCPAGGVA